MDKETEIHGFGLLGMVAQLVNGRARVLSQICPVLELYDLGFRGLRYLFGEEQGIIDTQNKLIYKFSTSYYIKAVIGCLGYLLLH